MKKELGQIRKAAWGFGGYQGAQIGLSITLGGEGWGVGDFWGAWAIERSEHAKWTEEDRNIQLGEVTMRLAGILKDAGKQSVAELAGTPVEVTFDGTKLESWRVLKEVL